MLISSTLMLPPNSLNHFSPTTRQAPAGDGANLSVAQETQRIRKALGNGDEALQHCVKLQDLPESQVTDGVSINSFATWRAGRFAVLENGFVRDAEDS